MKRAALYVRVSTEEQKKHGLSVDNQIVALREYCKENNIIESGLYSDAGISARKSYKKRPALLQLIQDAKNGKIDVILFTKLDRWFRSVADYYEVQKVLDDCNVPWRAIWEDYETETSSGVFKVNIMLSVAQSEADRTSERIRAVFDYKKANGQYLGTPPFGYVRKEGKLYKDPEKAPLVDAFFETYLKTRSTSACARKMAEMGWTATPKSLRRLLRNTAYCGTVQGNSCPAYITPEQYEMVQEIKKTHIRERKRSHSVYLFSGLAYCSVCGYRVRGQSTYAKTGKEYVSYSCGGYVNKKNHSDGFSCSELKMERYLLENLDTLLDAYNFEIKGLKAKSGQVNAIAKKKRLEAQIERIGIRFELGDISIDEFKEKRAAILDEISKIKTAPIRETVKLPGNWRDIYQSLDREHKKQFWNQIIKRIEIKRGGITDVYFL